MIVLIGEYADGSRGIVQVLPTQTWPKKWRAANSVALYSSSPFAARGSC